MTYVLKAPAKINIGLRVLSNRKDGYHNIETIFYPIKLFDIVKLDIIKIQKPNRNVTIKVTTNSSELKNEKKNICYIATDLFFKQFKISRKYRIKIHIKKNIPIGAGLGGGSSDAAAVLSLLYKHFNPSMHGIASLRSQIMQLGEKIGSDVPYFLKHRSEAAYATGKGETLRKLPHFKINYPMIIVYPGIHISTKWAYSKIKIQKSKTKMLKGVKKFIPNEPTLFKNDFENPVFRRYPEIQNIKERIYECGAIFSLMTGSGSAVYGVFKDLKGLRKLKHILKKRSIKYLELCSTDL